jgi:hypothetical protein
MSLYLFNLPLSGLKVQIGKERRPQRGRSFGLGEMVSAELLNGPQDFMLHRRSCGLVQILLCCGNAAWRASCLPEKGDCK